MPASSPTPETESLADYLPHLLHLGDTAFPCGAYAHSLGLEEIVRQELVRDEATLLAFLKAHILPSVEHVDLPVLAGAHQAARSGDIATLIRLDRLAGALKATHELRDASARMGRRRLETQIAIRPTDCLLSLRQAADSGQTPCHHVVVFAAGLTDAPLQAVRASLLHQILAEYCMAALKLFRIGQEAVHRVLAACLSESAAIFERASRVRPEDAGWFDPALDIASMRHEIADGRLFIS